MEEQPPKGKCPAIKWTKAAGWAAFFFFLVKGLLWLAVPALVAYYSVN
jgi:hypothetical protein